MDRREAIKTSIDSLVKAIPSFVGLTGGLYKQLTATDSIVVKEAPKCFPKRTDLLNAHDNTTKTDFANPDSNDDQA